MSERCFKSNRLVRISLLLLLLSSAVNIVNAASFLDRLSPGKKTDSHLDIIKISEKRLPLYKPNSKNWGNEISRAYFDEQGKLHWNALPRDTIKSPCPPGSSEHGHQTLLLNPRVDAFGCHYVIDHVHNEIHNFLVGIAPTSEPTWQRELVFPSGQYKIVLYAKGASQQGIVLDIHTGERRPDNKNITTRGNEALADRGSAPGIKTLDAHLSYVQLDSRTYTFDEPDHPTLRSRIEMDLRRTYGDDVFKGQVNYDTKNSKITPTEFNGVPVTERGYSVTNWKTEISPAIEKQIAADMKALDKVVQDKDGLQPAERLKFLEDVEKYASQLQNQHQPKTEINLNYHAHLADLFKKSMEDKALLPSVIKMHPDMPKAYQAYINILNETKDLEPNKRSQVIDSSVQTIAKNIATGNFPNIEITTPQLRQPPIAPEVSSQER